MPGGALMTPSQFGNRVRVRHNGKTLWASFHATSPLGIHVLTLDCQRLTLRWDALCEGKPLKDGDWCFPENDPSVRQEMKAVTP